MLRWCTSFFVAVVKALVVVVRSWEEGCGEAILLAAVTMLRAPMFIGKTESRDRL